MRLLDCKVKLKLLSVGSCYWDVLVFNTVFVNIVPMRNVFYNWFLSVFFSLLLIYCCDDLVIPILSSIW